MMSYPNVICTYTPKPEQFTNNIYLLKAHIQYLYDFIHSSLSTISTTRRYIVTMYVCRQVGTTTCTG